MTEIPSPRQRSWLMTLVAMAAAAFCLPLFQTADVPSGPAPAFSGVLSNSQPIDFEAWRRRHPGQAVALHFWADWCAICKAEEHNIDAVRSDWPVMTVAMQSGQIADVARVLSERDLRWPTVVDVDGRIARLYGLRGVPAFIVVDAQGRLHSASLGYTSEIGMRLRLWWASLAPP